MARHAIRPVDLRIARPTPRLRVTPESLLPAQLLYRHPVTGEIWDGRGSVPKWLTDLERDEGVRRASLLVKRGVGATTARLRKK